MLLDGRECSDNLSQLIRVNGEYELSGPERDMENPLISCADAAENYGVKTSNERMPNGEMRFRLTNADGNDFIRTVAGLAGAWQKAHYHVTLRETYVVVSGWMAIAEKADGELAITVYWPNDVVTTRPMLVHNVYLPSNAVIHTVKHGSAAPGDWQESAEFTARTSNLSEKDILTMGIKSASALATGERFQAYIALYNNLDNLIWRIPGFMVAGAAILIGFTGAVLAKNEPLDLPPILVASLFFFVGLLFFLSAFSMTRIREHHTRAGEELARMEPDGYFHSRRVSISRRWPPSATLVFRLVYVFLSVVFLGLAFAALFKFSWLIELTQWVGW